MNLQEFLNSGLLEAYILGHCNTAERTLVEQMLEQHPQAREELTAIETALEQFSQAQGIPAPAWVKGKIMDAINKEDEEGELEQRKPKGAKTPPRSYQWLLGVALLATATFAAYNYSRLGNLDQQNKRIEQQLKDCTNSKVDYNMLQAFLLHPDTRSVKVNWIDTTKTALDGLAIAYDNRKLNQVYVQVLDMPTLGNNQDYQFWVVTKKRPKDPIPYNVFQANSGIFSLNNGDEITAFAISKEPKGGSPNGKPSDVIMQGKV